MKIIEILSEKISEEIHDAKSYAKMALEYKEQYPDLARMLYNLSTEEMEHMSKLHSAVVGIIEDYRKEHGEPPAGMMAIYDYLHKKQIEKATEARTMQAMFKEN